MAVTLNTGDEIPVVAFGTYLCKPGEVYSLVGAALATGYRHIEVKPGDETDVAAALKDSGLGRKDIWLTATTFDGNVDEVLHQLGTEYVDLLLLQWPLSADQLVDSTARDWNSILEIWTRLQNMQLAGKARNVGLTNVAKPHLECLLQDSATRIIPAVIQLTLTHPSSLQPSSDLLSLLCKHKIYTALKFICPADVMGNNILLDIAQAHEKNIRQVLLRWALHRGWIVVPSATNTDRMKENFDMGGWALTTGEVSRIDSVGRALQ